MELKEKEYVFIVTVGCDHEYSDIKFISKSFDQAYDFYVEKYKDLGYECSHSSEDCSEYRIYNNKPQSFFINHGWVDDYISIDRYPINEPI